MDVQLNAYLSNLEAQQDYAENTRQAYASDVHKFVRYLKSKLGRELQVTDFTPQATKRFLDKERKSGLKPSTLHRRRVSLKHFAQYLTDKGLLGDDLVEKISHIQENLWEEISKGKVQYLSGEEVEKLLKTIGEIKNPRAQRDRAIISLMLEFGISISTLVSLNLSDINLQRQRLRFRLSNLKEIRVSIPKSAGLIQEYLELSRPELTQKPMEKALFVSQMGNRISRQGVWQGLRSWGRRAELSQELSPRVIRHTAARQMILEGRRLGEIQRLLGHRNKLSTRFLVRRLNKSIKMM
jgi:site-specific recombinase XerD